MLAVVDVVEVTVMDAVENLDWRRLVLDNRELVGLEEFTRIRVERVAEDHGAEYLDALPGSDVVLGHVGKAGWLRPLEQELIDPLVRTIPMAVGQAAVMILQLPIDAVLVDSELLAAR
jgi:hypothetical protein